MQWYLVDRTSSLLAFAQLILLYIVAFCTWLWKTCLGDGGFCPMVPGWTCTRCISTDGKLPLRSKSGLTSTHSLHWLIGIDSTGIHHWSFLTSLPICRQRGTNARFRAGWMNWINGGIPANSLRSLDRSSRFLWRISFWPACVMMLIFFIWEAGNGCQKKGFSLTGPLAAPMGRGILHYPARTSEHFADSVQVCLTSCEPRSCRFVGDV